MRTSREVLFYCHDMKKVVKNVLVGSAGEDRIGSIVQEDMGYIWRPNTRHDVGYDGEIEIRDAQTNIVSGLITKVQSKRLQSLHSETETIFVYTCDKDDMEYWMQSNVPDILVISKTGTEEIYWSPIKAYFADHPEQKTERKIIFDKNNVFSNAAKAAIAKIAANKSGTYLPPLPLKEKLYTNLLSIAAVPKKIYIAQTQYRFSRSLVAALEERNITTRSWILKNKVLMSFADLSTPEWSDVIDRGTLEDFSTDEWLHSPEQEKRNELIELMGRNLSEKCSLYGIKYNGKAKYYFFYPITIQTEREVSYRSQKQETKRQVIKAVLTKKDPKHILCYKHLAFFAKFVYFDNNWYLQITPTYHFTKDGTRFSPLNESMLKGLKRIQKNPSVRGEVICIGSILSHGSPIQPIDEKEYVIFGELVTDEITGGIDDAVWIKSIDETSEESTGDLHGDEKLEEIDQEGHNT